MACIRLFGEANILHPRTKIYPVMNQLPKRKPNRLKDFDYSGNHAYFITICTKNRKCILSEVKGTDAFCPVTTQLSRYGEIVQTAILAIPKHYDGVSVDRYIIMPNHVHILLRVDSPRGRMISAPTITTVIGQMKRWVSKQIGTSIWQASFHDHIIRDETDYFTRCQYIDHNPAKWFEDIYYVK